MPSNDHWLLDLHGLAQHADGRETATSPTNLVNALKQLSANVQVHVAGVFFNLYLHLQKQLDTKLVLGFEHPLCHAGSLQDESCLKSHEDVIGQICT